MVDGTRAAGSGDPSFQDTIKRASKTTARIRSSKKAAKITVSRMVPQSDLVSDALSPSANSIAYCPNFRLSFCRWRCRSLTFTQCGERPERQAS